MTLIDYQKCFASSLDEFLAQHHIPRSKVKEHLRYEKIMDVSRVDLGANQFFFFQEGNLRMIYISDKALSNRLWNEFTSTTKSSAHETVRSRAGKTSNQIIYAGHGISASMTHDEVDFLEIYPPCSLKEYLDTVYQEVGAFIR